MTEPRTLALYAAGLLMTLAVLASTGLAASTGIVVSANVASATQVGTAGCQPLVADVTSFGSILPGTAARTGTPCVVTFGSSNDTASLRVGQADASASAMNAIGGWAPIVTGDADHLGGITAPALTRAWVSGGNGTILTSVDNGATWSGQASGTFQFLEDVDAWDASTAWAVGTTGVLLATTNGTNWVAQTSGVGTQLNSVEPLSAMTVVVVGASGVVLRTTNGGTNWSPMPSGTGTGLVDVAAASTSRLWAVGYGGVIRRSDDGGQTWTGQASGTALHLLGVAAASTQRAWAVGQNGTIVTTTDGGTTWSAQTSPVATDLLDVVATDASTAWAVGVGGQLITTSNGGATWAIVASGATQDLTGIDIAPDGRGLVSAFSGRVVRSQLNSITDYDAATFNWTGTGANAFGACLASVSGGAATGVGTWVADVNATVGDCALIDGDPWNSITTTPTTVARTLAPVGGTASASLHFGIRSSASQPPGTYQAPLTFSVIAPSA